MYKFIPGILAILLVCAATVSAQVAVIAHPSVSDGSVNSSTLANIFSLDKQKWSDGSNIVVFGLRSETGTKQKVYAYMGKDPSQLKKVWLRKKLSGGGNPPTLLGSEEEVLAKVASTPGAIGYISADKVTNKVKVLATIN